MIQASTVSFTMEQEDMIVFFSNYRPASHETTVETATDLFYGRHINIKIPIVQKQKNSE